MAAAQVAAATAAGSYRCRLEQTCSATLLAAGQTELPTCPVCLERLDEHVSGVVTTVSSSCALPGSCRQGCCLSGSLLLLFIILKPVLGLFYQLNWLLGFTLPVLLSSCCVQNTQHGIASPQQPAT